MRGAGALSPATERQARKRICVGISTKPCAFSAVRARALPGNSCSAALNLAQDVDHMWHVVAFRGPELRAGRD
jgi:hypothetical protein